MLSASKNLASGLQYTLIQYCVLLCGKLHSHLTWVKRAKIFNIRKKIALPRETTLQHRTIHVGVKAACRVAVRLEHRPRAGLLLYTYIQ